MPVWELKTPFGTIIAKKGRGFGERVWREPPREKYGVAYFAGGKRLERDVFAHVNEKWIPSKGNEKYLPKMWWLDWVNKDKTILYEAKRRGLSKE